MGVYDGFRNKRALDISIAVVILVSLLFLMVSCTNESGKEEVVIIVNEPVDVGLIGSGIDVAAGIFIGIIQEDGQGPYQLILKEAARRANITINEVVYPLDRAVKMFQGKRALAIYGMTTAVLDDPDIGENDILTTFPLGVYKLYIFTPKGEPTISNYDDLKGKVLGGVLGYEAYYKKLIENDVEIDYLADESSQLEKLDTGRIDAVIGFMPDWIAFLDKLDYDPDFPVHLGYDYMTVWNTPEGRGFVEIISPVLKEMKQDGTLRDILGDRYMDFDYKAVEIYEW